MEEQKIINGMVRVHDIMVDVFWGNDHQLILLKSVTDSMDSRDSKFYPIMNAIINHVLSKSTLNSVEEWGFNDTPTREAIHGDISGNKRLVLSIMSRHRIP